MKLLDGCYYPGCDHPHPEGQKFCGCDHRYIPSRSNPEQNEGVCHCGDMVRNHCGLSHSHEPTPTVLSTIKGARTHTKYPTVSMRGNGSGPPQNIPKHAPGSMEETFANMSDAEIDALGPVTKLCPHSVGRYSNGEPEPCGEFTSDGERGLCKKHTDAFNRIIGKIPALGSPYGQDTCPPEPDPEMTDDEVRELTEPDNDDWMG